MTGFGRREFLKLLGVLPVALFSLAGKAAVREEKRYLLNRFSVAGFQYYRGPALLPYIAPGDVLVLKPEPDNKYDEFAVEIFWRGEKIGYVPVSDNKHISRLLQQGARLECGVSEKKPKKDPWQQLRIEVWQVV